MRITSQMLAANQLKAGIEPSSKTLLDYIQNKDDDSLTSLLYKKTDASTSSLTKKLQKDAYEDIKDDADSVTENAAKFTDEKSTLFADAEKTGDYSAIYADIKSVVDSYNKLDLASMAGVAGMAIAAGNNSQSANKKISLKIMTLSNSRQKINDCLGNPVEIGIAVMWKVTDTAKAVFNVDNYKEYLSLQCDSALRNIVRMYPYDVAENVDTTGDGIADEGSLRGSSEVVAERIRKEIQGKVADAGLEIIEARITYLAYAPEIAAVMLQRQQASAIVDARKMIVDGAVGMVEMALERLSEKQVIELDEERKAAMVSNLLVVLCGNKDAQPVVNSGSLY